MFIINLRQQHRVMLAIFFKAVPVMGSEVRLTHFPLEQLH